MENDGPRGKSIFDTLMLARALYSNSRRKRKENKSKEIEQKMNDNNSIGQQLDKIPFRARAGRIAKDFVFVWVLLGLLVFYIFSVRLGTGALSEVVFALGNVVVEILLVFYLLRNRDKNQSSR
jgi:Flp pilus assembly protein TadB